MGAGVVGADLVLAAQPCLMSHRGLRVKGAAWVWERELGFSNSLWGEHRFCAGWRTADGVRAESLGIRDAHSRVVLVAERMENFEGWLYGRCSSHVQQLPKECGLDCLRNNLKGRMSPNLSYERGGDRATLWHMHYPVDTCSGILRFQRGRIL